MQFHWNLLTAAIYVSCDCDFYINADLCSSSFCFTSMFRFHFDMHRSHIVSTEVMMRSRRLLSFLLSLCAPIIGPSRIEWKIPLNICEIHRFIAPHAFCSTIFGFFLFVVYFISTELSFFFFYFHRLFIWPVETSIEIIHQTKSKADNVGCQWWWAKSNVKYALMWWRSCSSHLCIFRVRR